MNKKVVLLSLLAIVCLTMTYTISWYFIVPVAIIIWINQKELFSRNNKK